MPSAPFRIDNVFGGRAVEAPRKGQHNRDIICAWLGREPHDLATLCAIGAI
jgi:hypothetical protein